MTKNGISTCERQVFIGENRVPVRLVISIVPPEIYQQRIRRKEKENKRKGHQTKEQTKLRFHFNLFITNVEATILSSDQVMPLYRLRWQVELMFKNWKSVFSIHNLQKMKAERYITMLYIRLILIVVNLQIIDKLQSLFSAQGKIDAILSYNKTLKTLKNRFAEILGILRCTQAKAIKILLEIYRVFTYFLVYHKNKPYLCNELNKKSAAIFRTKSQRTIKTKKFFNMVQGTNFPPISQEIGAKKNKQFRNVLNIN